MIVETNDLMLMYGIQRPTLHAWIREGMPIYERGVQGKQQHKFDTREVIEWREKRAVNKATGDSDRLSKEEAQRRKISAEAALAELDLAKKKGEVAELSEVEQALKNQYAELRSNLRKIPERCYLRLVGEMDEFRIKQIILSEVDSVLETLANGETLEEDSGS